jgi:peptide/nickel transport system permease protein
LRHILPNVLTPVIVITTFSIANVIILEAALSFLGVGVEPTIPTWGNMLYDGRGYLSTAWWMATFPGLAIMLTVLGINLIGDWLRDILDPRLNV